MKTGTPLTDDDRWPWLHAIAAAIDTERARGNSAIVACSALKRAYRDITIGARRGVTLVYLKGEAPLIHDRIAARTHRYMPPALLGSQFETLEVPGEDEHPVVVPVHGTVAATVLDLLRRLATRSEQTR